MKKRLVSLFIVLCLCLGLMCTGAYGESVCFISVNDSLLDLGTAPYLYNSSVYVPYSVFKSLSLYCSSVSGGSVVFYTDDQQLCFDLANGTTYDGNDRSYDTYAIYHNGTTYVPALFVCSIFGFNYSYLSGTYGDVVRMTDGNAVLSDKAFMNAAHDLMKTRYNAYIGANPSIPDDKPSDNPTSDPSPDSPGGEDTIPTSPTAGAGKTVFLAFTGIPSDSLLNTLDYYSISACFYLTANNIRSNPDMVRRLTGSGHHIGVYCYSSPESDYAEVSALIYEAAKVNTVLIACPYSLVSACSAAADGLGLSLHKFDLQYSSLSTSSADMASALERRTSNSSVLISTTISYSTTSVFLKYMHDSGYTISQINEAA